MALQEELITCTGGNAIVLIDSQTEHLQKCWLRGGFYEKAMLEHIRDLNLVGDYIDIGSCIGNHTLFFAKFCKSNMVISIEPVVKSFFQQMEILELNKVGHKIIPYNVAVGENIGRGRMDKFGTQENVGMFRLEDGNDVDICRVDDLIDCENIVLIKIDVEGGSLGVLKGAQRILEKCHPRLFIELNGDLDEVSEFLYNFDYTRINKFNSTPTYEFI